MYLVNKSKKDTIDILIYGDIGMKDAENPSVNTDFIVNLLESNKDKDVEIRINSDGGGIIDGLEIYNAISNHKGNTTIFVDKRAASIASLIAMAGKKVMIADNAEMMIHAPYPLVIEGANSAMMRKIADSLDRVADYLSSVYSKKTGRHDDFFSNLMKDGEDHTFTAQECVENKLCDSIFSHADYMKSIDGYINKGFEIINQKKVSKKMTELELLVRQLVGLKADDPNEKVIELLTSLKSENSENVAAFAKQLVNATDDDKVIELLTKLKNEKETLEAELVSFRSESEAEVARLQSNLDAVRIELETNKVKSAVQLARSQGKIVNDKDVAEFAKAGFSFVQRYLGGLKVESALAGMQTQNSRIYADRAASDLGTPDGFDLDLSRVDLHNRAAQYAKAHNVSYTVAIKQVSNV